MTALVASILSFLRSQTEHLLGESEQHAARWSQLEKSKQALRQWLDQARKSLDQELEKPAQVLPSQAKQLLGSAQVSF